jgi:phosphatidylserine/phosphatidylglycerophosphate/cardiolipin synthase-like enzyme
MGKGLALFIILFFVIGIFTGYYVGYREASGKGFGSECTFTPSPVCIAVPTVTVTTTVVSEVERQAPAGVLVEPLFDRDYFSALVQWVERANVSIHVVMYAAKYDPSEPGDPVNQLLNKLAYARSRGVDVRVVVDDETAKSYPQTIDFLKNSGIAVKLDESSGRTTHAKLVIIDGKAVLVGSHNWTESALSYNHEASVLIISQDIAEKFEEYFESIWSSGRVV